MDLQALEGLSNIGSMSESSMMATAGSGIGMAIGSAFGAPTLGAGIGSTIGTVASNFLPQYNHVKGSSSGVNFVKMGLKPYLITLYQPDDLTAKALSDKFCYYGNKTSRIVPLNINSYVYENHAFVKGDLQYNGSIPLDKFAQINKIFSSGVHILNS